MGAKLSRKIVEMGCCSAQALSCSWFPVTAPNSMVSAGKASRAFIIRPPKPSFISTKLKGCTYLVDPVKLRRSCLASSVSDRAAVPNDCNEEQLSSSHATPIENEHGGDDGKVEEKVGDSKIGTCDQLIDVFMIEMPTPVEWRRLLAFSKKWDTIRPHFYKRCQDRADNEDDLEMKHKLLRFARKFREVDADVQRHNDLLQLVKQASSDLDISELVRRRHKDFTKEFFVHLDTVGLSYTDKEEQDALAIRGRKCVAVIQAYNESADSIEAINAAELKFMDLINSPTPEEACKKIDQLARKNELDPALLMMITKSWSEAKQSTMMKEEAKEIMFKMYMTGIRNLEKRMPKDVRILKRVLKISNPERLYSVLKDAFTPTSEIQGKRKGHLYTTPEKLLSRIQTILDAFYDSRPEIIKDEAKGFLYPKKIIRMERVKEVIVTHFI